MPTEGLQIRLPRKISLKIKIQFSCGRKLIFFFRSSFPSFFLQRILESRTWNCKINNLISRHTLTLRGCTKFDLHFRWYRKLLSVTKMFRRVMSAHTINISEYTTPITHTKITKFLKCVLCYVTSPLHVASWQNAPTIFIVLKTSTKNKKEMKWNKIHSIHHYNTVEVKRCLFENPHK